MRTAGDKDPIMATVDPDVTESVAREQLEIAMHNWRESLHANDLPESISPHRFAGEIRQLD